MERRIKILDISYYMTCPPVSGGALRIVSPYMKMTEEDGITVDFLFSTWEKEHTDRCLNFLSKISVINSVTGVVTRHYLNTEQGSPDSFSNEVWVTISKELENKAIEMVQATHYDIIQIEHSQLAWIVPSLRLASPQSKIILDLHNAEHLIYKRWLQYARSEEQQNVEVRYKTLYDWEKQVWSWFDGVFTVSSIEAQMVRELGQVKNVFTVPTGGGIDVEKYTPKDEARQKPYDLLYLGTMEWYPNAQGLLWFIDKVLPYIIREMPNVKLNIVGFGNPMGELVKVAKSHPNIKFWGEQEDDIKFFHGGKVFIVPLWIGAGARVKIPTAWASKIPIVSTGLGAEGLDARHMENIILADEPYEFAAAVIKLLQDEDLCNRIVENAYDTVKSNYTVQKCVDLLKCGYDEILRDSSFSDENKDATQGLKDYHIQFIERLSNNTQLAGKDILEIGCGDGSMLKKIAKEFNPNYIVGIDTSVEGNIGLDMYRDNVITMGDNWKIEEGDVHTLSFKDDSFDVVISVACFEHIIDVNRCLTEINRVLKPGGVFYTDFAPIWSSIVGHHWYNWILENNQLIPPWGHLWMTEQEMREYLEKSKEKDEVNKICYSIYHDPWINRLDVKQLEEAFSNCSMKIELLNKTQLLNRLGWLTGASENELTDDIINKLDGKYSSVELLVSGFEVLLRKI